jgi:hypothetical protein
MMVWRRATRRESLLNSQNGSQNHPTQKDVKNEGSTSEFVENKGAKKWSSEFIENRQVIVF